MFKAIFILSIICLVFLMPVFQAQAAGIVPEPSGTRGVDGDYTLNDFIQLAVNISEWILGIVGSLTLLMFIYGGFTWILSGGNSEAIARGKKILIGAVIGMAIVFTSYTIIQFTLNAIGFEYAKSWFTVK